MMRVAAVRPDGTITRIVTASSVEAVDLNIPPGSTKIAAPADVRFGSHTYDFADAAFRPVDTSREP